MVAASIGAAAAALIVSTEAAREVSSVVPSVQRAQSTPINRPPYWTGAAASIRSSRLCGAIVSPSSAARSAIGGVEPDAVAADDLGPFPEHRQEGDRRRPQVLPDANADVLQHGGLVLRRLAGVQDRDELVDEGIGQERRSRNHARIRRIEPQRAEARRRHALSDHLLRIAIPSRER